LDPDSNTGFGSLQKEKILKISANVKNFACSARIAARAEKAAI
jgi:hypothetical protein